MLGSILGRVQISKGNNNGHRRSINEAQKVIDGTRGWSSRGSSGSITTTGHCFGFASSSRSFGSVAVGIGVATFAGTTVGPFSFLLLVHFGSFNGLGRIGSFRSCGEMPLSMLRLGVREIIPLLRIGKGLGPARRQRAAVVVGHDGSSTVGTILCCTVRRSCSSANCVAQLF